MRQLAVAIGAVLVLAVVGCGDDAPEPVSSGTSEAADALVVSHHTITPAEYDRIDDDGAGVLGCEGEGGPIWDHGAIGPDDERGREPEDELRAAIVELNSDRPPGQSAGLPLTGWVRLDDDDGGPIWFLLADGEDWHALVNVGGDPDIGVWRRNRAILCQ